MESGFFLDIVIRESSSVFKLFTGKDESLLIWWDSFFVLDFGFDILNGVWGLNIKSDCLTSEGLDKDLHTTSESEYKVKCGLFLDVIIWESSSIFQLFTSKNESLLIRWDTFFVLDLCFDVLNGVWSFDIECNCFTCEGFYEYLHVLFVVF